MFKILLGLLVLLMILSCKNETNKFLKLISPTKEQYKNKVLKQKIGVLVISHGSHSSQWRDAFLAVTNSIKNRLLINKDIKGVEAAFVEYNEPSMATQLKKFDSEDFSDIIIIPLFLTVSGHTFDHVPHIVGLKDSQYQLEKLKVEKIEVYKPRASITITSYDFTKVLGRNIVKRLKKISNDPKNEGCVLVAYGERQYNDEWITLLRGIMNEIESQTQINHCEFSWCGHLVLYSPVPTTRAIERVLQDKKKAIVIPVLVAVDEMFQGEIIGNAIESVKEKNNVIYKPDSILPDKDIDDVVVKLANKYVKEIKDAKK